jgi:hypothetical protein
VDHREFRLIRTTFLKSGSTKSRMRWNWLTGALYSPDFGAAVMTRLVTSIMTSGNP